MSEQTTIKILGLIGQFKWKSIWNGMLDPVFNWLVCIKQRWVYSWGIFEANLLDFGLVFFLGQGLNLKMELEEIKLSLSAYKTTMKTRTQIVMIMMEKGIFPLWTFIIPEGIIEERSERRIILKVRKK
jgi:hypothetical protein